MRFAAMSLVVVAAATLSAGLAFAINESRIDQVCGNSALTREQQTDCRLRLGAEPAQPADANTDSDRAAISRARDGYVPPEVAAPADPQDSAVPAPQDTQENNPNLAAILSKIAHKPSVKI